MVTKFNLSNFIPLLAIPAALFLPQVGQIFSPYTAWILGALLFCSFLGLGLDQLIRVLKKPLAPFLMSLIILVVTPLVIYPIMQRFFPEYFLGALLFMLLPSAVSAPAVTAIYRGNVAMSTVNSVFSNLLSPFTITLFLAIFVSASVQVRISSILVQLLLMIVIPFILSVLANRFTTKAVEQTKKFSRFIALVFLFLLFFAALSPYSQALMDNFFNGSLWLAVLVAHAILYFFAKLTVLHNPNKSNRISIQTNLIFLNVGLAVVLAQNFFGPTEMLFIIFCQIVWVVMIGIARYVY